MKPSMSLQGPAAGQVISGLATLNFNWDLAAGSGYELRIIAADLGIMHRRALSGAEQFWLALNTHLIGNGKRNLRLEVARVGEAPVWSDELSVEINNGNTFADLVSNSMLRHGTPLVFDGRVESGQFDYRDSALVPWFDRPDALEILQEKLRQHVIEKRDVAPLEQFIRDGYAVLDYRLDDGALRELNRALDWVIETGYQFYQYGSSQRIEQLHRHHQSVAALWRDPNILDFLSKVFASPALPCQTLTYVFGSQQDFHQDTIHLTPFPAGYMCGVWVALEDVREDSGELAIVPGSHRFPRVYRESAGCDPVRGNDWTQFGNKVVKRWQSLLQDSGLREIKYRPPRGTILIWHENLMHGGSRRLNQQLSRRSIVSHYFAKGALAYYDSTALPGYMFG